MKYYSTIEILNPSIFWQRRFVFGNLYEGVEVL
jgi:hypothetical protein